MRSPKINRKIEIKIKYKINRERKSFSFPTKKYIPIRKKKYEERRKNKTSSPRSLFGIGIRFLPTRRRDAP